jgi:hypothetical protein
VTRALAEVRRKNQGLCYTCVQARHTSAVDQNLAILSRRESVGWKLVDCHWVREEGEKICPNCVRGGCVLAAGHEGKCEP